MKDNRYRTARLDQRVRQYNPSTTELILEQMCESFGTELLSANIDPINGTKLVRKSRPAIVEHPRGEKRILQFQYTKFSPFCSSRWNDVYNKNRMMEKGKRKLSYESSWKEIRKQYREFDEFEEVINPKYIEHLNLHRWEKEIYFAVYDAENKKSIEKRIKPFSIHGSAQLNGRLPRTHITFRIEPHFVIGGGSWQDKQEFHDSFVINFPEIKAEHSECVDSALSLHPLDKLREPEKAFIRDYGKFGEFYEINSSVPRQLTMSMIAGYLRKLCLDKDFY